MKVTLSQAADAILSRHTAFRDKLVEALGGLPGVSCFIDGRVGRAPPDDRVVLMCSDHEPINISYHEFADAATVKMIVRQWSSPPAE
jgi:hypothetical protein